MLHPLLTHLPIPTPARSGAVVSIAIADLAPPSKLGTVMGLSSTAEQIGRVGAPLGLAAAYEVSPSLAFTLVGTLLFVTSLFYVAVNAAAPKEAAAATKAAHSTLKQAGTKVKTMVKVTNSFKAAVDVEKAAEGALKRSLLDDSLHAFEASVGIGPSGKDTRRRSASLEEVASLRQQLPADAPSSSKGGTALV